MDVPGEQQLLTVAEVGELFAVPEKTVRELVTTGCLPTRHGYVLVPELVRSSAASRRQWAVNHELGEWVARDEAIRGAQVEPRVDPNVIRFLLAYNGVFYAAVEKPVQREKLREAYRKKIMRGVEKKELPNSRASMIDMIRAEWKRRGELRQTQTLFDLRLSDPRPPHRPWDPRWRCCLDLRNYFCKVTGSPQMKHVAPILFPDSKLDSVEQGWSRIKQRFDMIDGEADLEHALRFYDEHREKVHEAIKSGTPLRVLPTSSVHNRAASAIVKHGAPLKVILRRGQCPRCGTETEWMVGSPSAPCQCGMFVALSESYEVPEAPVGEAS